MERPGTPWDLKEQVLRPKCELRHDDDEFYKTRTLPAQNTSEGRGLRATGLDGRLLSMNKSCVSACMTRSMNHTLTALVIL
jgi:hypothetical protein